MNDRISRAGTIRRASDSGGGTHYVHYSYIGLSKLAKLDYAQPDVQLDYSADGAGNRGQSGIYPGYDRFGRIGKQMWVDGGYTTGSGSNPNAPQIYYHEYRYDKSGNRLAAHDTRPGIGNGTGAAQKLSYNFQYDGLHRLKQADRGLPTSGGGGWTWGPNSQQFTLDMLDNWSQFKTDSNGNGSYSSSETETRTNDNQNRITKQTYSTSSNDRELVNDKTGNLREVKVDGGTYDDMVMGDHVYDAWHRLVKVYKRRNVLTDLLIITEHQYNALGWRTVEQIDTAAASGAPPDGTLDRQTVFFYDENWRLVAEEYYDQWSSGTPGNVDYATYNTPGPPGSYIDEVVHRGYFDGGGTHHSYILRDPQYSTVALIDTTAKIRERVDYSAFGIARHHYYGDVDGDGDGPDTSLISGLAAGTNCSGSATIGGGCYHAEADLDRDGDVDGSDVGLANGTTFRAARMLGDLSITGTGSTSVNNRVGYCGYAYNYIAQSYSVRMREYAPHRGRWLQADPSGYPDGSNRQSYMRGNPIGWVDPFGLQTSPQFQGGMSADPVQFGSMANGDPGGGSTAEERPNLNPKPWQLRGAASCNPPANPNRTPGFDPDVPLWMGEVIGRVDNALVGGLVGAGSGGAEGGAAGFLFGNMVAPIVGTIPGTGAGAAGGAIGGGFYGLFVGFSQSADTPLGDTAVQSAIGGGIGGAVGAAIQVTVRGIMIVIGFRGTGGALVGGGAVAGTSGISTSGSVAIATVGSAVGSVAAEQAIADQLASNGYMMPSQGSGGRPRLRLTKRGSPMYSGMLKATLQIQLRISNS